jgi:hypothetical protein
MKDAADIQAVNAGSIRQLLDAGFEADSVISAITSGDLSQLKHTGLFSVQLQPAGAKPALNGGAIPLALPALALNGAKN